MKRPTNKYKIIPNIPGFFIVARINFCDETEYLCKHDIFYTGILFENLLGVNSKGFAAKFVQFESIEAAKEKALEIYKLEYDKFVNYRRKQVIDFDPHKELAEYSVIAGTDTYWDRQEPIDQTQPFNRTVGNV